MVIRARDTLYLKTNNEHCMFFQLSLFVVKIQINLPICKVKNHK